MVKIENRSIMGKDGKSSPTITLPSGHSIINGNDLNMVISDRIIILAPTDMKTSEIKEEGTRLLNDL